MTKQTTIVVTGALRVNISAGMNLKFNILGKVKTLISIKGVNAFFFFFFRSQSQIFSQVMSQATWNETLTESQRQHLMVSFMFWLQLVWSL